MADVAESTSVGRYRLEQRVGEGATAVVWRAQDSLLGRTVAVKILKPTVAQDPATIERFYAEARAAGSLEIPAVARIYDIVDAGPIHALVMEFVDGPSLATILAQTGKLPHVRAIGYIRGVTAALEAAHAAGILHRDIKPANVLTTTSDDVRVVDFGLAKALELQSDAALTMAGNFVGSASYLSPEQAQGAPLTPASDLYSVGVLFYQMLVGTLPFAATSAVSAAVAHVTEPAPSQVELERSMPPALAAIVHQLLQKDPAARMHDARELDVALERSLAALAPAVGADWDAPTIVGPRIVPPIAPPASQREQQTRARATAGTTLAAIVAALLVMLATLGKTLAATSKPLLENARRRAPHFTARARELGRRVPNKLWAAVGMLAVALVLVWALVPREIAATNVEHTPLAHARSVLTAAGLVPTVVSRPSSSVGAGLVLGQTPGAGTRLHRGDRVTLAVSTGPQMATIPNLAGRDMAWSQALLTKMQLRPQFAARFSDAPANAVIDQIPSAGTRVRVNSTAIVVLSTGPQFVMRYKHGRGTGGGRGDGGDGGD